jgi:hypothetical protein
MNAAGQLRFRADGSFVVLQVSDVQDASPIMPRTLALLVAALRTVKPDLVVFTGDQVKGYDARFALGTPTGNRRLFKNTIDELVAPLERLHIPFTFVFGNHDHDVPITAEEQLAVYQSHPLCLAYDSPGVPGCANHNLQVMSADGTRTALNVCMLDSHGAEGFGWKALEPEQLAYYREERDRLAAQNGGEPVPTIIFQHFPVTETLELFTKLLHRSKGSMRGYASGKGAYYQMDTAKVAPNSICFELPNTPVANTGLFDAAHEKGDVVGIFFGHDHNNGFVGDVRGIRLGYAPGAGYTAPGPGLRRGVRSFRFEEENVRAFETHILTDEQMLPGQEILPMRTRAADFLYHKFPKPLWRASSAAARLIMEPSVLLMKYQMKKEKREETEAVYEKENENHAKGVC